ncbi:MAG: hypothetical protein ACYTDX_04400 [Planctomycetota bacterium]
MPKRNERLHASGWRRSFDGSAVSDGAVDLAHRRCDPAAGRVLVFGGDLDMWMTALPERGLSVAGFHPSRLALADLRDRLPAATVEDGTVALCHADLREFEPPGDAGAALLPAPALSALGTASEREDVFREIAQALPFGAPLLVWLEELPRDLVPVDGALRLPQTDAFDDPQSGVSLFRRTEVSREPGGRRVLVRHAYFDADGEEVGSEGDLLESLDPAAIATLLEECGFRDVTRSGEDPVVVLAAVRG